ncbi:MAG TPA: hypothetical protein VKZ53_31560 [Candidatus Angelobacter sp.]|nr:hypothetical protein [Candidatus Angelobacter sp.]
MTHQFPGYGLFIGGFNGFSINQLHVIYYGLLWGGVRVRGCFRRWKQPLLRGEDWFFSVPVQHGFYSEEGATILRQYRVRMLSLFAIEVPAATAIFLSGQLQNLVWLILAMCILIHVNHVFSVNRAEQRAQKFATPGAEQPVSTIAISLKARRLRDFTNFKLEAAIAAISAAGLVWALRYYATAPEPRNLWIIFGTPLLLFYCQGGFLLAKVLIVAWRSPIPQVQAEEHIASREETRKFYLRTCDLGRINLAVTILFWPALLSAGPETREFAVKLWFAGSIVLGIVIAVWSEIKRKDMLKVTLRARPVKLPQFGGELGESSAPSDLWPLCYEPSAPTIILRSMRGYSLNLANRLTQLGAVYLAGLLALFVLIRFRL